MRGVGAASSIGRIDRASGTPWGTESYWVLRCADPTASFGGWNVAVGKAHDIRNCSTTLFATPALPKWRSLPGRKHL